MITKLNNGYLGTSIYISIVNFVTVVVFGRGNTSICNGSKVQSSNNKRSAPLCMCDAKEKEINSMRSHASRACTIKKQGKKVFKAILASDSYHCIAKMCDHKQKS